MTKENPLNTEDKIAKRLEPELETDKYSVDEMKEIVKMVVDDARSDIEQLKEWINQRALDLKRYDNAKPSELEGITKKPWQSDRNLGLYQAFGDAFHATLLATCFNPDTIHFKATEANDLDNTDILEQFTRWGIGPAESNIFPEVDDFICNRIQQGFSVFHVRWDVKYEWVDRRIPNKKGGYDIKTEKMRFEKGIIENIDNLEDFLCPTYGKNIQDLPHCIHILHMNAAQMLDYSERKIFTNITKNQIQKLKSACFDSRLKQLGKVKADALGLKSWEDITETDLRQFPIDIMCWYGEYEKNGKKERYRFHVEPVTRTFCAGKPLRKITRKGKYPFVGGPLIRRPGLLRGTSLMKAIAPAVDAFNNVYNQKSDFQYVTNCPIGFHVPDENFTNQQFDLAPGVSYPVSGDPNKTVNFPNIQRSMAWAYQDMNMLFEILERLTGAASFFMTNDDNVSGTATRDQIISQNSETRFSLWVHRIIVDICEAIDMWLSFYQDWAPPDLGKRVLGEKGEKLFPNLSIRDLRGNSNSVMSPDIIAGSKVIERQIASWNYQNLMMSPWFDVRINPRGNWDLTSRTAKAMGNKDIDSLMPPKPPSQLGSSAEVKNEWYKFMQGDRFDPQEGEDPIEHYMGHMQQKEEKYNELPEEYRPNFDDHLFKSMIKMQEFIIQKQNQQIAEQMAMQHILQNPKPTVTKPKGSNGQPNPRFEDPALV